MSKHLPAGITDSNVELFAVAPFKLRALHSGSLVDFGQLPPNVLAAMSELVAQLLGSPSEELESDCWCLFGGFDSAADFDSQRGTFTPEFWDCGLKETCPKRKKLCLQSPNTPSGRPLSRRELEYIKLRAQGHSNAEVAQQMSICESTIISLYNHVKEKLKPKNVDYFTPDHNLITMYAINNNLI
jgi:DNA-binding CsgD family transcriptional regulator